MNKKQMRYENRKKNREEKRKRDNAEFDNYDAVFTYEHLLESAKKCRSGVNWKASVQNFSRERHYNAYKLFDELKNRQFKIRSSYEFDICERGKKRHILSVHIRERTVQKCLCDYCLLPILSKTFIYDNCASLKGKGTAFALDRLKQFMLEHYRKHGLDGYVLLFDFHDYFGSVPHETVMKLMRQYITDQDILQIVEQFVNQGGSDRGLGLGNQVSQVAALLVASPIDHYIKDRCRVQHYIRYMDDGILIHESKEYLEQILAEIRIMANDLGLEINDKKTRIVKFSDEFQYLKKKIRMDENGRVYMRLLRPSVTRMRRRLKKYRALAASGKMDMRDVGNAYQSWRNYALKYDAYHSAMSMDALYHQLFSKMGKERGLCFAK